MTPSETPPPTPAQQASFAAPDCSAEYLRVRCVECGWGDGLRTDCVTAGDTWIACDRCGDWRACELIPSPAPLDISNQQSAIHVLDGRTDAEAHEWECKTCGYLMRLEIGPLCCEGGVCNECHGAVEYHGMKYGIPKSTLGVAKPPNSRTEERFQTNMNENAEPKPETLPSVSSSELLALAERFDGYAAEWRAMADKNVQTGDRDSFQWCDGQAVSYKHAAEEVRKIASANNGGQR